MKGECAWCFESRCWHPGCLAAQCHPPNGDCEFREPDHPYGKLKEKYLLLNRRVYEAGRKWKGGPR